MNILLALNVDFDSNSGGLERSAVNLITYLSKQPSIKCVCAFNKFVDKIDNIFEIETIIRLAVDLKKIITDHHIDIVLLPGGPWYTLLAAEAVKNTNCKIITAWHFSPGIRVGYSFKEIINSFKKSFSVYGKLKVLTKIAIYPLYVLYEERKDKMIFRESYLVSDRFVVLSASYISNFKQYYAFSNVDKMVAISNSLSFPESISKESILIKDKTILIVARLDESSKRLTYALKIWKLLEARNPEWKLQLVGEGKDRTLYECAVIELQLKRVFFEGKQQPQSFYKKAAIFMMTSKHEGWGLTLTEA
ncbi:glycosyltransferase, partial [Flavobacterium sp.]|uniref:glycosyltransferase n=1 Tax=Flavobacterium sp. TaxID=239 RepID=UPI00261B5CDE